MKELGEEYFQNQQDLRKACRLENEQIVFDVKERTEYKIPLSRCDTYQKIVSWTTHLLQKNWVTSDVLKRFIELACSHHRLDAHGHLS